MRISDWSSDVCSSDLELHEHQVPDLDEAIAVLVGRTRRAAGDMRAMVVEDLGAGAAGTGVGHLPEVVRGVRRALVVADAADALGRQADVAMPDVESFVVGLVDGDQQPLGGQRPARKSVLSGTCVPVRADLGARRIMTKTHHKTLTC